MAAQFPMFRLVTLLARQVAAPVAAKVKKFATTNAWFRRRVCMALGRGYHVAQLRLRLWALALPQPRALPPLPDSVALERGANLLGEIIIFAIGSLILILELNRQGNVQELREGAERSQRVAVLLQLQELEREVALQQQDIERLLAALRRRATNPPPAAPAPPHSPDSSAEHINSSTCD